MIILFPAVEDYTPEYKERLYDSIGLNTFILWLSVMGCFVPGMMLNCCIIYRLNKVQLFSQS